MVSGRPAFALLVAVKLLFGLLEHPAHDTSEERATAPDGEPPAPQGRPTLAWAFRGRINTPRRTKEALGWMSGRTNRVVSRIVLSSGRHGQIGNVGLGRWTTAAASGRTAQH